MQDIPREVAKLMAAIVFKDLGVIARNQFTTFEVTN